MMQAEIIWKHEVAARRVQKAFGGLIAAYAKSGFDPGQPRVPSGNSDGGQWTDGGGGSGSSSESSGGSAARNTGGSAAHTGRPAASGGGARSPVNLLDIAETMLSLTPQTRGWGIIAQTLRSGGRLAKPLAKLVFGGHKSVKRWTNQMKDRGWTLEEIAETIAKGKKFPAPNKVNPSNTATRHENTRTGKYIVRDDKTGDILQIGDKDFDRPPIPKGK